MKKRAILTTASVFATALVLASIGPFAAPRPSFPNAWSSIYPNSPSQDHVLNGTGTECQLCHERTAGGDSWNAYGWAIKQLVDGGENLDDAIMLVEAQDSDGDPGGFTNLDEIQSGAQPGWTPGPNNTIFDSNGSTTTNQLPPGAILGPLDSVSYPTVLRNGTGVNPVVLADTGGDPNLSPRLNSLAEPFGLTFDCSTAPANGVYSVQIRENLLMNPPSTPFGELLFQGPILLRWTGFHNTGTTVIGPTVLPYDLMLVDVSYIIQGFCGSSSGGAFLSNALEQRIGV